MNKIMHDQDIRDELLEEVGEEAVEDFGACLSIFNVTADPVPCPHEHMRKMLAILNQVLVKHGSTMRVEAIQGYDDDGFYWEVSK
jgi:hypothetical protein